MHDIFRHLKRLAIILVLTSVVACSKYQKALKSTDPDFKYQAALEYYEKEKYEKAYVLFDELVTLYRGSKKAQDVYFYYAYTNYHLGDYILAAYHFKNFYKTFPRHKDSEEAAYMVGYCYYLESPVYSLEQTYTYKAINELQLFVNTHRESDRLYKCNELIQELRSKLEKKSFEIARLYYQTEYYQAAVVAFNNTLNDFPDTRYREEALYMRFRSSFELANNSIPSKRLQRFIESKTAYFEFIDNYPESENAENAKKTFTEIQAQIKNLKTEEV